MRFTCLIFTAFLAWSAPLSAEMSDRAGWSVMRSDQSHADLVANTRAAIKENGLIVVTQAGPTKAAAARGIEIPGNTVIGAFNNDFAVRLLALSTPAMIEAPIRFYVTENADGTATLSYKTPTAVLEPYVEDGAPGIAEIAAELDALFATISKQATVR
ncbi:MAG: DUF302 domain-containing protein [Pseudomonadota bacterium]